MADETMRIFFPLKIVTYSQVEYVEAIAKQGRYGGTYAHQDIAFEFSSWISIEFKLYLIKEIQRLKAEEQRQLG